MRRTFSTLGALGTEIGRTTKSLKQFYDRESNETYIFVQIMSTTRQYNIISSSSVVGRRKPKWFSFHFFFVFVSFDFVCECARCFVLFLALREQKSSSPSLQHGFSSLFFRKCRFISLNDAKKKKFNIHHKFLIYETSKSKPERWLCPWERTVFLFSLLALFCWN